jgi:hypothetical protein
LATLTLTMLMEILSGGVFVDALEHIAEKFKWHKLTLAVQGKMPMLSGRICNYSFTKPYLTKVNIPCPDPAGGSRNLAEPGATLPQPIIQTLVARLLN